jgi:hypothetical protein
MFSADFDVKKPMYEAMHACQEIRRLARLFRAEREDTLTKIHKQCSLSPTEEVHDNHLTCCLGKECRKCERLKSLDSIEGYSNEAKDEAKAWTCLAHILMSGGDPGGEGYILTEDDKMYWSNVYESLSRQQEDYEEDIDDSGVDVNLPDRL